MTAVIMTSAIVVLLAFTRAAFGSAVADELAPSSDRSLTYLYYYSPTEEAVSGGGNVRRPTASVLSRLYVAEVDHRRRLEGDDERPAIVEIGPPVRLPAHQRMYNNETDMNAELDQWRSRYSSTVTAAKSIAFDTARGQVLLHSRSHTEDRVFSLVAAGVCPGERLRTPGGNGQWSKYGAPVSGEQRRGFEVDEIFDEANIQPTNYKVSRSIEQRIFINEKFPAPRQLHDARLLRKAIVGYVLS